MGLSALAEFLFVLTVFQSHLFASVGCMYLCRSYALKENERRCTLGLQVDESPVELEDNEELTQLGMMFEVTSASR